MPAAAGIDEQSVVEQLVAQAREKGIELVGTDGLFSQLTKRVLDAEVNDHLGYVSTIRLAATVATPVTDRLATQSREPQ